MLERSCRIFFISKLDCVPSIAIESEQEIKESGSWLSFPRKDQGECNKLGISQANVSALSSLALKALCFGVCCVQIVVAHPPCCVIDLYTSKLFEARCLNHFSGGIVRVSSPDMKNCSVE